MAVILTEFWCVHRFLKIMGLFNILKFCKAVYIIGICSFLVSAEFDRNQCISKETCNDCITAAPGCVWCKKEDISDNGTRRCDLQRDMWRTDCEYNFYKPSSYIVEEMHSSRAQIKNVQFDPEFLELHISPSTPVQTFLHFQQKEDFPVDLYFIVDFSKPTEDYKFKISLLNKGLVDNLRRITSNFRLGFGSFVGQISATEGTAVAEGLENPSASATGFRNHMPLSMETARFDEEVQNSEGSEWDILKSQNGLSAILDAIMQAVVCKRQIGWRQSASKILLFSSNSGLHNANFVKIEGNFTSNEHRCRLDRHGHSSQNVQTVYTVDEVNQMLKENEINVIFAVTPEVLYLYMPLSAQLEGSRVLQLGIDPSNVLKAVRENYEAITTRVELRDSAPSHIKITYSSSCLGEESVERNFCEGLRVGNIVSIKAFFEVSCPKDPALWNDTFSIYPVGINERTIVDVELICECP